jgi:hypothetical protein
VVRSCFQWFKINNASKEGDVRREAPVLFLLRPLLLPIRPKQILQRFLPKFILIAEWARFSDFDDCGSVLVKPPGIPAR